MLPYILYFITYRLFCLYLDKTLTGVLRPPPVYYELLENERFCFRYTIHTAKQ